MLPEARAGTDLHRFEPLAECGGDEHRSVGRHAVRPRRRRRPESHKAERPAGEPEELVHTHGVVLTQCLLSALAVVPGDELGSDKRVEDHERPERRYRELP